MRVTFDTDAQAIAAFDLRDVFAFLVHDEVGNIHWTLDQHLARPAAHAFFLDLAQDRQSHIVVRPDQACAMTVRARLGGGLNHAGTQTLARHFQQAKARNAAHLNARAVSFQLVFQTLLDGGVVFALIHVDEVDHNQTGQVAQTQLARHLFGGFQVGLRRGFLDRTFARCPARVHVDGNQCFRHADHDIAAGFQLHSRVEHPGQVAFHLVAREERQRVLVFLHILGVGRHDHLHEVLGDAVAAFAFHKDFVDLSVIEIADRPFDQVAFFVDLRRCDGFQRQFADLFPHPQQIFIVALDLGFGAFGACGAHDQPRALRHVDLTSDFLELLAVCGIGDLTGNTAAACSVRH